MDWYERVIGPLLFRIQAERAHHAVLTGLGLVSRIPGSGQALRSLLSVPQDARLAIEVAGLTFPNPIGLAAGVDKDAIAVSGWFALGFGSVEIGTVTPCPQAGNPRPRLWRFPAEEALVNALGFPSAGSAVVRERLVGRRFPGPVGVNLGKNAGTPLERAAVDYEAGFLALWDVADYVVINVSSPNTPGLRTLQDPVLLGYLVEHMKEVDRALARLHRAPQRPIFVKVALDIEPMVLDEVVDVLIAVGATGLIVGNTSTDPSLRPSSAAGLPGGLSGRPVQKRARDLLARAAERADERLVLVSVGGVMTAEDVVERIRLGAHLVQLYTGLVYRGPRFPAAVLRQLLRTLDEGGLYAVGALRGRLPRS